MAFFLEASRDDLGTNESIRTASPSARAPFERPRVERACMRRHGIEDTAMAVREARRQGQSVFGVTIDRQAKSWFARMFGQGGFAVIPEPSRLTMALPQIYRQLVGG